MLQIANLKFKFFHDSVNKITHLTVKDKDDNVINESVAKVHHTDQFCKKAGRKVAITKAIQNMDKQERTAIWQQYFATNPKWK